MVDFKLKMEENLRLKSLRVGILILGLFLMVTSEIFAQTVTISGQVMEADTNQPFPGATVVVKGTTNGTITDFDGNYIITNVPADAIISFSFIGMKTQEIAVAGQTVINVTLESETIGIEEVVAVGYGTVKKSDLTGSVGSLDTEMMTSKGTATPMEALQGQVAGVNISASSGRAGSDFSIKIRGDNSLAGGDPLYVVDGIISDNIQFVNPQDIERIDILKDASSTAIYGSRGSNGVIIVTTKSADKVKKPTISYDGYYGVRSVARLPEFMNGDQWWAYRENAYLGAAAQSGNDISDPSYDQLWVNSMSGYDKSQLLRDRLANKDYTDWPSYFLSNGTQQNHYLSISGQSENKISYIFGIGYQQEKGNMTKESFDRYNLKASVNHQINEKWSAGTNVNVAISTQEMGSPNAINNAFRMSPLVSPYGVEGYSEAGELLYQPSKYEGISFTSTINPLLDQKESEDQTRDVYMLGNVYLQFKPLEGLTLKTTFSPEFKTERQGIYWGSNTEKRKGKDPAATLEREERISYTWDNQLTYEKLLGEHKLNFMFLQSLYSTTTESSAIAVENLPYESLYHNLGSAQDILSVESGYSKVTLASVIGRLNYSYKGKYLLTASLRSDGSSKLSDGHKWAAFPSAAFGWRVIEEDFMKDISFLSNLKARLSYGYTGNNNIDAYSTQMLASTKMYYDFGGTTANGFAPSGIANNALTWEKTREWNVGVDFGILQNRISGSLDYYNKLSQELLMDRKLPIETGWGTVTANVGSVRNKGIEAMLKAYIVDNSKLTWEATLTFAKNNNEIVELYGGKDDDLGNEWFIDQPINVNYNYVFDGIWKADQADEAASYGQSEGQAKVKDFGNDGIDDSDRRILGTPDPDYTMNLSTTVRYKGFDFNTSLYSVQGVQVYSYFHQEFLNFKDRGRAKLNVNYYMPENNVSGFNDSDKYPMPINAGNYWLSNGVGYYKDASFIKVKNISLGYTFASEIASKVKMKNLRVYFNVLNPIVITDYDGFDPEWAGASYGKGGVSSVTYQFGVNCKF